MSRYTSATDADRREMLAAVGVESIDDLFADVPEGVRLGRALALPPGKPEQEVYAYLRDLAAQNVSTADFGDPVFKPYVIREVNGVPIGIIGQAFPYTPIANPRYFVADWTFGIKEEELQKQVDEVRSKGAKVVVLLSHNGMDVDLKLATRVKGLNAILGGHTHDAVPQPVYVRQENGGVAVAGTQQQVRRQRGLVRRADPGEVRDLARPCLGVQALGVTRLGDVERGVDEHLEERQPGLLVGEDSLCACPALRADRVGDGLPAPAGVGIGQQGLQVRAEQPLAAGAQRPYSSERRRLRGRDQAPAVETVARAQRLELGERLLGFVQPACVDPRP